MIKRFLKKDKVEEIYNSKGRSMAFVNGEDKPKDTSTTKMADLVNKPILNKASGYRVEFTLRFENIVEGSDTVQSYARTKTMSALIGETQIAQIILKEIRRNERFCLRLNQIPNKVNLELRYIEYSPIVSTVIATRKVEYQAKTDMKRFKRFYVIRDLKK